MSLLSCTTLNPHFSASGYSKRQHASCWLRTPTACTYTCACTVSSYSQAADIPRLVLCGMFLCGAVPTPTAAETALCYFWPDWARPSLAQPHRTHASITAAEGTDAPLMHYWLPGLLLGDPVRPRSQCPCQMKLWYWGWASESDPTICLRALSYNVASLMSFSAN